MSGLLEYVSLPRRRSYMKGDKAGQGETEVHMKGLGDKGKQSLNISAPLSLKQDVIMVNFGFMGTARKKCQHSHL